VSQEEAEHRVAQEIERIDWQLERQAHARPLFSDCAKRFLLESKYKRSASEIAWHIRMLLRHVGDLEVRKVHDDTLRPFVEARLAEGVSETTVNRSLEVVRAILRRAARAYRDVDGTPLLEIAPPLITMLPENPRLPYPLSWDEQDRIFQRLPARLPDDAGALREHPRSRPRPPARLHPGADRTGHGPRTVDRQLGHDARDGAPGFPVHTGPAQLAA
jgi:hypothetical protein